MRSTGQVATMRTWREDGIVLSALFAVGLSAAVMLHPVSVQKDDTVTVHLETIKVTEAAPVAPLAVPLTPHPKTYAPDRAAVARPLATKEKIASAPAFITLFGDGAISSAWMRTDRDSTTGFWRNDFRKTNIASSTDGLSLSITAKRAAANRRWDAGEIASTETYGYGRYEAIMKPARGEGLISSFFTYTGPWMGTPHDEIDIEFLGKDTRRVEFNMFRDGKPDGSKAVELPFDAADAFHLYTFDWHPDHITWRVDGKVRHRVLASEHKLPRTPSKIMMNIWTGKMPGWHGDANFTSGSQTQYACVSYTPFNQRARSCSDYYTRPEPAQNQHGPHSTGLRQIAIEP